MQASQSERIPWLCEELGIPYTLVLHQRDPNFSPQSVKDLNPMGQAPVIQDGSLTLAESAACVEYIIHKHGNGRLALSPGDQHYADYLYWFHFANGTFQPSCMLAMQLSRVDVKSPVAKRQAERFENQILPLLDARLQENPWLAGDEFSAADIMSVSTSTTMRTFFGYDLSRFQGILDYLKRVTQREGYQKARAKADPDLELMIDGKPPPSMLEKLKAEGKI